MIAETVLCLILGDSIAIGLHRFLPECEIRAKTGITTSAFVKLSNYEEINAPIVIISLGTNDLYSTRLLDQLDLVRKNIRSNRVYWVLPNTTTKRQESLAVTTTAIGWGDRVIWTDRYATDHIHPSLVGYRQLVEQIK